MANQFVTKIDDNIQMINELLKVRESFDLLYRVIDVGDHRLCFYFIDGLSKDEIMEKIMEFFYKMKPEDFPSDAYGFSKRYLPYGEVDLIKDTDALIKYVLSGVPCLFIDGYREGLAVDFRTYPARSVDEPEKDKVMRGSRDGFVETLVFNTALIRRRIRDPQLTMEMFTVGHASKTDVVVSYMGQRVDKRVLTEIKQRIEKIDIDSLTMNGESLAECLYQHKWYNPFPKFKFSERPDAASAAILEGNIVILVDNSPAAIIVPTSVFDIIEDADDYYFPPITGTYLRLSRFVIDVAAVIFTPLFLLLMQHPQWIPKGFEFIYITDPINIPILWQFLLLEFAVDGMRLASLNTPSMLSTPLSVVAGIVLGDFTVSSGWFNAEIMLYMAFVAVANYTQSSFELGYALKFMRIITLILTGYFGLIGFVVGLLITGIAIIRNKTLSGRSYIYPLIPFNGRQLLRRFFRISLPRSEGK
ncbi:spore germination protein [Acetivibrio ethanolgignens]|uniref:Spore gernimation protein GerA n=1 Tax=Acetivibrio ethanolgignens TaxID=290052 RepID=A0A0V8QAW6_9FIRM|nr:spore germination protein [Acetivibrio ethanolgignens]KSV57582.1 spore gernimation protein GerA [Acetivibrio ethanolgignens]